MGYRLSFLLSGLLIAGAFIAQYNEMTKSKALRNDTMPWILFSGGIILMLIGSREYRAKKGGGK
jgi:hypothetical protein